MIMSINCAARKADVYCASEVITTGKLVAALGTKPTEVELYITSFASTYR